MSHIRDLSLQQAPVQYDKRTFCTDGVAINVYLKIPKGMLLPQHSHTYPHHSLILGTVGLYKNGIYSGDVVGPDVVYIEAGVQHSFLAKTDGVMLACIINLHGKDEVELIADAPNFLEN